ncbi:alpha/beta fold hydrolase [Fundicoccus culcitae]|uniref:Alpha/beta hydrolase n=1 Tax=Fundicoccus culcitae TaxID=2969821 RepID=A0ABY5P8P4_9LACT|nr:alpha/beta hydrolase [Fundicoccus culcitae]UUX34788.1 alpha/beta hydrolase [Fundicoccus culcitae]
MKWSKIVIGLIVLYLFVQYFRMRNARQTIQAELDAMPVQTAELSYGKMTFIDNKRENAEVILSLHGLYGGYDQAYNNVENFSKDFRIIAPSRFGYLASDVKNDGSPHDQAEAIIELLDYLEIPQINIIGTSAGGTPALRLALDYPERVKTVILYSSASPAAEKPTEKSARLGPPSFLNNDYLMWLLSPMFEPIMGMDPNTINWMLPLDQRRVGADIDASITNPDMLDRFDQYPIESLQVPVLIIHAKDDKVASYEAVAQSLHRYPDLTTKIFETGGHLLVGHEADVESTVKEFIENKKIRMY